MFLVVERIGKELMVFAVLNFVNVSRIFLTLQERDMRIVAVSFQPRVAAIALMAFLVAYFLFYWRMNPCTVQVINAARLNNIGTSLVVTAVLLVGSYVNWAQWAVIVAVVACPLPTIIFLSFRFAGCCKARKGQQQSQPRPLSCPSPTVTVIDIPLSAWKPNPLFQTPAGEEKHTPPP